MNYYCFIKDDVFFLDLGLEKKCSINSYNITYNTKKSINTALLTLHNINNVTAGSFSLCFDFRSESGRHHSNELIKNDSDLITQFFFHANYFNQSAIPVVFILINKKTEKEFAFEHLLKNLLISQGYKEVAIKYITTNNLTNVTEHVDGLFISNEAVNKSPFFEEWYYQLLDQVAFSGKYLCFEISPEIKPDTIIQLMDNSEKRLQKEQPLKYVQMETYYQNEIKIKALNLDILLTRDELANQKEYLRIIKQEDQANKIATFYHNEYEVLPLWYKKLGHLIKVVIGKRTFRSLFNDNVKKYKD